MLKLWKYIFGLLAAAIILVGLSFIPLLDNNLHLVFCDVGQGDAILVYKKSYQVLVDGGPDLKVLKCLSNNMPFWDRKIELVVLSHGESDHYTGLIDVAKRYKIGTFASSGIVKSGKGPDVLAQELEKSKIVNINAGDKLSLGGISLKAYWPTKDWLVEKRVDQNPKSKVLGWSKNSDSLNSFSAVLKLSYKDFNSLLTGDMEPPAIDTIPVEEIGHVEVLKVPHHGSRNGLTENFLQQVSPQMAVISVGKNNKYGHPSKEIIELLSHKVNKILRTDLDGEIEIVTDGKRWWTFTNP